MTKLHVLPRENGWAVKRESTSRASKVLDTKKQAVSYAKNLAGPDGYVFVHKTDGEIQLMEKGSVMNISSNQMDNCSIHVTPSDDQWAVRTEKTTKPSKIFNSKYLAVRYAHQMADCNNATMIVHNGDGKIDHVDIPPHYTSPTSALLYI